MNPHNNQPTLPEWPMFAKCIRLCMGGTSLLLLASCSSSSSLLSGPKSEIVVSVKDQKLGLYHDGVLEKHFDISTSKFGLGDQLGSYKTPLGKHEVIAKIGHGLPTGAVLKSRSWNGEVLKPNAPGRDPIVSRILWLRGMEMNNRNAMKRFIYIHGTTEEERLGKPASYGCIRMGMKDVVDLFNDVSIGAKVEITKGGLPHGAHKPPPPAADPAQLAAGSGEPPKTAAAGTAAGTTTAEPVADATAGAAPADGQVATSPAEEPKTTKREERGGLFGSSKTAQATPEAAPPASTTAPVPGAAATAAVSAVATAPAPAGTNVDAPASEPALAETAPAIVKEQPRRAGFFSFLSKKKKTAPAASPPPETGVTSAPETAPVAAVEPTGTTPTQPEAKPVPPSQPAQAQLVASPPSTAPPEAAPAPALEPAAPRKRSGFFGLFSRSKKPAPQVATTVGEPVLPDRTDMGGTPTQPQEAAPQAESVPEKPEALRTKAGKTSGDNTQGASATGRQAAQAQASAPEPRMKRGTHHLSRAVDHG